MKTLLIVITLGVAATSSNAHDYEVKHRLVRRGMESQKLEGFEVGVSKAGVGSDFSQIQTYRTDSDGKAVVKFKCDRSPADLHFKLLNKPGWYVYAHGTYPGGADDTPHTAHPTPNGSVVGLVAFPEEELDEVYLEAIAQGKTHMIASAVKTAVLEASTPAGPAEGSDPLIAKLSQDMKVKPQEVKDLLVKWDEQLMQTDGTAKLDEKMLAALSKGDIEAASKFAIQADGMSDAEKSALVVMPDTKALLGSVLAVVVKAQAAQVQYPNPRADQLLGRIKAEISVKLPNYQSLNPQIRLDPNVSRRLNQVIRER